MNSLQSFASDRSSLGTEFRTTGDDEEKINKST